MIEKLGDQYKMVEYLDILIDLYEKHRCFIFYLICLSAFYMIVLFFLNTTENRGYKIRKKGQVLFAVILDGGMGILVHKLGFFQSIEYAWFDALFFIMILSAIVLYMIAQMIYYKRLIRPILKNVVYLQYLIFAEVFLLAATNHLDVIECIMVAAAIILLQLMPDALRPLEKKQQEEEQEEEDQESDFPNSELYGKRKQQLKNFIPILEQQKKEPYAILISGAWGSGKSSFVKALEKQLKDDHFIWIYAGSEKNSSIVMSEISRKIIEILQKNNVYIEQGNLIEEYFEAFSGVLEEKVGYKYFKKIANLCETGVNTENRDYLNEKLREVRGTVYLVIDDLDRCDAEYKEMMFKVIRESTTELTKCKTIFLADEEAFWVNEKQGKEQDKKHYIEKYIGYTLELCKVEYQEISDYYIKIIFGDDILRGLNPILLNGRSADEIRDMICQCPEDILQRYRNECKRYESQYEQGSDQDKKHLKSILENKEALLERIATVEKNVINSRKVKNFMKGIKRNLENINKGVEKCSQEFQKLDWIQAVIRVQFVKNILPELFDQLKQRQDIIVPQQKKEMNMLFALNDSGIFRDAKTIRVINEVVYNIDVIDFEQMMTEKEKYLGELHGNSTTVNHINEYVKYAESYKDLKKVVMICKEYPTLGRWEREIFLKNILDRMGDHFLLTEDKKEELLELSVMLIEYLKNVGISEQESDICIQQGHIIAQKIILANVWLFQYVLKALFTIEKVDDAWHFSELSNIDELYRIMKDIDSENMYVDPNSHEDCLIDVRKCCEKMKQELLEEMTIESGIDFEEKFGEIELVLKNYQYWQEIERNIEQIYEDDFSAFKNYFSLHEATVFHNNVFESIETLVEALTELKKFYVEMAGYYQAQYYKFLESISYKLAIYPRNHLVWFKGREAEVANLLTELAGEVSKLNKLKEGKEQFDKKEAKQSLDLIMLYIFNFKKNIEKK